MLQTLTKPKIKHFKNKSVVSPYFQKPKKLDVMQGINERQNEVYKYTLNFEAKQITQQDANFWGFKIQYLRPWTEEAKRRTGQNKVDIIAHSMGGLVTRSYIQSNKYQNDIRNFVMVGTPNQGSANPYFIWEGGDPITLDILTHGFSGWSKYFYTNTIYENYQEVTDKSDLCIWKTKYVNTILYGPVPYKSDIPIACNKEKVYDFVHKNAPSLGQLMPAYSGALVDTKNNTTKDIEIEKNEFLLALNNGSTFNNETYDLPQNIKNKISGELTLAYGNNWNTIKNISIDTSKTNNSNYLYKDGIVDINPYSNLPNVVYERGDGTVPQSSAQFVFDEWLGLSENKHAALMQSFILPIVNFISINP